MKLFIILLSSVALLATTACNSGTSSNKSSSDSANVEKPLEISFDDFKEVADSVSQYGYSYSSSKEKLSDSKFMGLEVSKGVVLNMNGVTTFFMRTNTPGAYKNDKYTLILPFNGENANADDNGSGTLELTDKSGNKATLKVYYHVSLP